MKDVIHVFQERKQEIDIYFDFLETFMKDNSKDNAKILHIDGTQTEMSNTLAQILRANGFLLLYNVIESCITLAIEEIYKDIKDKNISFDILNEGIKKEIFSNIKNNISTENLFENIQKIEFDIVSQYPTKIFSGNVDARKIKDVAKKYGFAHTTDAQKTQNGEKLVSIKNQRNSLAHGDISFKECGKEYTIQEMNKIREEAMCYLAQILQNIENYIVKQEYKV